MVGLYKTERVRHDGPFRAVDDLALTTLSWVHWFNTSRLHSSLNNLTPIEHEDANYTSPLASGALSRTASNLMSHVEAV